jgi:hypothetical protein
MHALFEEIQANDIKRTERESYKVSYYKLLGVYRKGTCSKERTVCKPLTYSLLKRTDRRTYV